MRNDAARYPRSVASRVRVGRNVAADHEARREIGRDHASLSELPSRRQTLHLPGVTHLAAPNSERNAIDLTSLDAPNERRLLLRARSNAICTNDRMLFVRENDLLAQPLDPETLKLGREAKRVADAVEYEAGYFTAALVPGPWHCRLTPAPQELFTVPRRAVMDVTKDGEKFLVYEPVASADTPLTLITNWH
jgi:hypothetical protein